MQPGGRFCSLSTSLTQRKINNKNKTVNARTHTHQKKKKDTESCLHACVDKARVDPSAATS